MVWREEELLATEILANIARGHGHFYMISRGREKLTAETVLPPPVRAVAQARLPEFPDGRTSWICPKRWARSSGSRRRCTSTSSASTRPTWTSSCCTRPRSRRWPPARSGSPSRPPTARSRSRPPRSRPSAATSWARFYARDFKMVDQSDLIVSLVPELPKRQARPLQRRRARAAPRLRGGQGGVRRLGVSRHPQPLHHRDGDARVQERGGGDRLLRAEGVSGEAGGMSQCPIKIREGQQGKHIPRPPQLHGRPQHPAGRRRGAASLCRHRPPGERRAAWRARLPRARQLW